MPHPDTSAHQPKIRVLIVDDIPETRHNLRRLLFSEADFEPVWTANDGKQAVKLALGLRPDVVLMDVMLPEVDGITAAEIILDQVPLMRIIMMSARDGAEIRRRAASAGASEYLVKPFSGEELVSAIRRVHRRKR